jgi:hypothetical protein
MGVFKRFRGRGLRNWTNWINKGYTPRSDSVGTGKQHQHGLIRCFIRAWRRAAAQGRCDQVGSAEFRRVLGELSRGMRPLPNESWLQFIVRRANVTPQ